MNPRPPREWFARCVADVAATGSPKPVATCADAWARTSIETRARARREKPMASKKGKKHAKRAHHRAETSHVTRRHRATPERGPARKTHRTAARHAKTRQHHRCALCNHASPHVRGQGCLHFDGKKFCTCKHRG